ncbi:MAG: phosphotransferase, partial [bacterium]
LRSTLHSAIAEEGVKLFGKPIEIISNYNDIKKVLKIPLSPKSFYEYEGTFLLAWEKVGVSVPHVVEEGTIDGSYYLLMDFIDAKTLQETYKKGEMIRKEIFMKMGSMLRTMHTATSEGFGSIKDGKGRYAQFNEWLADEIARRRPDIDEVGDDFSVAVTTLSKFIGSSSESRYCHNDFAYQNIFATEPLTVFDPVPVLNHPYMDLAGAIIKAIGRGISDEAAEQLIKGYSDGAGDLDRAALQAALIVQSHMLFTVWSQTGKEQGIKDVRAYLEKTNNLLTI